MSRHYLFVFVVSIDECGPVPDQFTRALSPLTPSTKWLTIGQDVRNTNSIIIFHTPHCMSAGENICLTGVLILVRDTITKLRY